MLCPWPCAVVFLAIYMISNAIFTQLQHKTFLCNPQSSVSPMSAPNRLSSRWRIKFICAAKVPKRVTKGQADHAHTHDRKEGRLFGDGALQCIDHWCSFAHLLIWSLMLICSHTPLLIVEPTGHPRTNWIEVCLVSLAFKCDLFKCLNFKWNLFKCLNAQMWSL